MNWFANQVLLYAKGWYGHSEGENFQDVILKDLTELLNIFTGGGSGKKNVRHFILQTFLDCVECGGLSEYHSYEALQGAFGWHWGRDGEWGSIKDGMPEECLLAKLSQIKKEHMDFSKIRLDIFFGSKSEKERIQERAREILKNLDNEVPA